MENNKKIELLLNIMNEGNISKKDVENFVVSLSSVVKKLKENVENQTQQNSSDIDNAISVLTGEISKFKDIISEKSNEILLTKKEIKDVSKQLDKALLDIELLKIPQFTKEEVINDVISQIELPEYKETILDNGDQIIEKVNNSDKKIDVERIDGLSKFTTQENIDSAISILDQRTQYLINKRSGSGVQSVVAGTNVTVDNTDPQNPIVNATGGSGDMTKAVYDPANINEQLVGLTATQTLTNKTLTEPKFADNGFIADQNGNQMLAFNSQTSAVNYLEIENGATGSPPHIRAKGSAANIGLHLVGKGTSEVNISDGTDETKRIRFNVSGNSSGAITTITSNSTTARTINFPNASGTIALTSDIPSLKTNGTTNATQNILNLKSGTYITVTDDGLGGITFNYDDGGISPTLGKIHAYAMGVM